MVSDLYLKERIVVQGVRDKPISLLLCLADFQTIVGQGFKK